MAKNDQEAPEEQALSEEQRIAILEKMVRLHRWLVFSICLLIIVALSVFITFSVVSATAPDAKLFTPQNFRQLQQRVAKLEQQNRDQQTRLKNLHQDLVTLEHSPGGTEATKLMRRTLIGQDQSFQQFIKAMQSGMHDLANMIPGSRTWLDVYEDALGKVAKESDARLKRLKQDWPAMPSSPKAGNGSGDGKSNSSP